MDSLFIEALEISNEVSKDIALFNMVDLQYDQMYKDAEVKVATEGGTSEDLMYLYKEADEETTTQKENIFTKIINGIKNLIQKIIDGITNFFSKTKEPKPNEEEIEIPSQLWADMREADDFVSNNPENKIITAVKNNKKTAIVVASSAVAVGATIAIDAATGFKMLNSIKSGLGKLKGNTIDRLFSKGAKSNDTADISTVTNNSIGFLASVSNKLQGILSSKRKPKDKTKTESVNIIYDDDIDFTESAVEKEVDMSIYESKLAEIEFELFGESFNANRYLDSLNDKLFGDYKSMQESANLFGDDYYHVEETENEKANREILEMIKNL